ncbi:hypothetical protein BGZ89_002592, partial [Linnemannia elongata]
MRHRDVLNHHHTMLHAIIALSTVVCLVTAETPVAVHSMAYTTVNEKTLYIQGGNPEQAGDRFANQFYALDLTRPNWDTTNPPWNTLDAGVSSSGAPSSAYHFMTVVDYGQSLMIWSSLERTNVYLNSSRAVEFNISNLTWSRLQNSDTTIGNFATFAGFAKSGATDPKTNLVYIPALFQKDTGMTVYNITQAAVSNKFESCATTVPMPQPLGEGRVLSGHSTVWSEYSESLLVYGGRYEVPPTNPLASPLPPAVLSDRLVEYQPLQKDWTIVTTKGESPGKLASHCMVPAEGGRKMIVFGGSKETGSTIVPEGGIYILDVPSWTWSQGTSVNSSDFRAAMACSVAADNFIAWGGTNGDKVLGSMIIYNLRSQQWTTRFSPGGSSAGTSSVGGIIGGSVAAAVVVGAIAGYVVYRRRRWRSLQDQVSRQDSMKHGYDLDAVLRDPRESVDSLTLNGAPRDPASIPLVMEFQFPPGYQERNPEYTPVVHFQGFQRTDPQYSNTPLQEPWRNPHGMAIPEHIVEDNILRRQWILQQRQQQRQAALLQQEEQQYLGELERLRREYEQLQA